MLGKRLINSNSAAGVPCTTDTLQILGDTSCIAYYKMSDATDESGNFDGTPTSVNFNVAGKFGNAGSFNGVDTNGSRITIPSLANWTSTGVSASIWVKLNNTPQSSYEYTLISFAGNASFNWGITDSRKLTLSGAGSHTPSTGVIPLNIWTQVAVSITSSQNVTFYINGSASGSYTNSGSSIFAGGGGQNCIGSFKSGTDFYYSPSGELDQIRIFNKALSSSEVTTLYNEVQCVPTIVPTANFNTVIWDGDSATSRTLTGIGFEPSFTWFKSRTLAASNNLVDAVRGSTKRLVSENTSIEVTASENGYINNFNGDGFVLQKGTSTHGTYTGWYETNQSGQKYVAWNWKAGGAAVQNNDGSITGSNCLVSANQNAGFSITKYTGNGTSGATFGHGLGKQVELSIVKNVGSSGYWYVYSNLLPTNNNLYLNTSDSKQADGVMLGGNSTTVSISASSAVNTNSGSYIAYNFASIAGHQKVGSYTGTAATDNPIVTGFRPAFVMVKGSSNSGSWIIYDNKRNTTNPRNTVLYADSSAAESTNTNLNIDFQSNGFVLTGADTDFNGLNRTYIYLAIAEEVFNPNGVTRNATNPFGDASEKALYKFEDNANDAEGNYNGTASNVTYATGYIDKAAVFNGSSSYITASGLGITGNTSFTISTWVNTTSSGSNLFFFLGNGTINSSLYISVESGGVVRVGDFGTDLFSSTTSINDGNWHHIALTSNGTTTKLYIDGSESNSLSYTWAISVDNMELGRGTSSYYYNGSIDNVRIFNRALDSGEVTQLYNE